MDNTAISPTTCFIAIPPNFVYSSSHATPGMSRIRRLLRLTHETAQTGAKIEKEKKREIHFDDELPEHGLRQFWRLAEERHPGSHRVHERVRSDSPQIRRVGVRRRLGRPQTGQARASRQGLRADHRR